MAPLSTCTDFIISGATSQLHSNRTLQQHAHGGHVRSSMVRVEDGLLVDDHKLQVVLTNRKGKVVKRLPLGNDDRFLLGEQLVRILLKVRVLLDDGFADVSSGRRFHLALRADTLVWKKSSNHPKHEEWLLLKHENEQNNGTIPFLPFDCSVIAEVHLESCRLPIPQRRITSFSSGL